MGNIHVILSLVLYGCENWSLTMREEGRLRVFENGVLRKVFGPKGDEVTGEWIKLHSSDHVRKNEMGGAYGTYRE